MASFFEEISKAEIAKLTLFEGLNRKEIDKVVECLAARECFFPKDQPILNRREDTSSLGIILKGSALCLFNRLFGEKQKPEDGFRIDAEGETPKPYKLDSPDSTEFEKELWGNFWKLAQDPDFAKKMGVRAAHGAAPSMKLQEGSTYKLEMRNTGELTFLK